METLSQLVNSPRTLQSDLQVLDNLQISAVIIKFAEVNNTLTYFGLSSSKT